MNDIKAKTITSIVLGLIFGGTILAIFHSLLAAILVGLFVLFFSFIALLLLSSSN